MNGATFANRGPAPVDYEGCAPYVILGCSVLIGLAAVVQLLRTDKALIEARCAVVVPAGQPPITDPITTSKRRYQRPLRPKCVKRSARWIGY